MSRSLVYLISALAGFLIAGCASFISNEVHVSESEKPGANAVKAMSSASIRIAGYVDGRSVGNARKIGKAEGRVVGLHGTDIILDRDVTEVVGNAMRRQLEDSGLRIVAADDATAMFELSGVVKELKYDVKARDYVLVKLETTLKDLGTGKVVWSGEVEQKNDRYAGVVGNTKNDIADYLKQQLGVVTDKTAEAIKTALKASHPELFSASAAQGAGVAPGVTVFVTPGATPPAGNNVATQKPPLGGQGQLGALEGWLVVRTMPSGAKVYLDGVYYGMSPLTINSAAGIRTVEAKLKGYRSVSEKVAVRTGATTELEFELEK